MIHLEDHVVVYGGDAISIAATIRMLQLRQPGVEVMILSMGIGEEREVKLWQGIGLDRAPPTDFRAEIGRFRPRNGRFSAFLSVRKGFRERCGGLFRQAVPARPEGLARRLPAKRQGQAPKGFRGLGRWTSTSKTWKF